MPNAERRSSATCSRIVVSETPSPASSSTSHPAQSRLSLPISRMLSDTCGCPGLWPPSCCGAGSAGPRRMLLSMCRKTRVTAAAVTSARQRLVTRMTRSTVRRWRGLDPGAGDVRPSGQVAAVSVVGHPPILPRPPASSLPIGGTGRSRDHGGVRFPPETVGGVGDDGPMSAAATVRHRTRPGVLLPRGEVPRPPLRRGLLHRGPHHRDLLPAVLPGAHARFCERHLPPQRGRRPGRRLPGLQALPARRDAGESRLGRRGHGGRPCDAADRRRGGRPGGRRRAGAPRRLHVPAPEPDPGRRARRGAARPRPGPPRPDRARPDRDDRVDLRRRRLRGRLLQRAAVQRHRARGVRRVADRAARAARRPTGDGHGEHAARGAHARSRAGRCWTSSPTT